jgi:hypothetical protein
MKQIPRFMMRHRVVVEPFLGTNATGEVYGVKASVNCMFTEKVKMVRNAQGEEVSSSSSYITTPDHAPPENSRVLTPFGDVRKVVARDRATWPGMSVPANSQIYLD